MDRFNRLMVYLGGALFVLASILIGTARAEFPPQIVSGTFYEVGAWPGNLYESPESLCKAYVGYLNAKDTPYIRTLTSFGSLADKNCRFTLTYRSNGNSAGNSNASWNVKTVEQLKCPQGAGLNDNQMCQCGPAYKEVTGNCVENTDGNLPSCGELWDNLGGDSVTKYTMGTGTTACYRGCLAVPTWQYGSGDNRWGTGPWHSMGAPCTPGEGGNAPKDDEATQCGPGKCPGTVNGTSVCVPCDWEESREQETEETTNPDGTTTEGDRTEITRRDNGDGTITETTRTTHPDGSVTETTRTYPKDAVGEDPSEENPMDSFCEENPEAMMCQEEEDSTFGGACGGTFNCDGDAIQCAIATEQHKRACELFEKETDLTTAGKAALGKGDQPDWHPYKTATDTPLDFASLIDRSDGLGGSCPAGHSVTVNGHSVVVLTADMCDSLELLGRLVVAVGALLSVFIVFRA